MPGRGGRRNDRVDEDSRPLLVSSREDLSTTLTPSASSDNVLFSIEGDQDEYETSALEDTSRVCLCIVDVGQLLRGCSRNLYRIRPRL